MGDDAATWVIGIGALSGIEMMVGGREMDGMGRKEEEEEEEEVEERRGAGGEFVFNDTIEGPRARGGRDVCLSVCQELITLRIGGGGGAKR